MNKIILAVLAACTFTSICFAQEIKVGTDQVTYFDSIFAEWESDENPGLTLGILQGDQVVYQRGYGLANIDSKKIIDGSSQFRVSALSMHYTAYALLLLEEKGALKLEDDVRKYLPNLPQRNEIITLEHLLTHSSGLPGYWPLKTLSGFDNESRFNSNDALTLLSKAWELSHNPGDAYTFKGTGPSLIAKVIEKVSGKTLNEFTTEEIFKPLGLNNTYFITPEALVNDEGMATPYLRIGDKFSPSKVVHTDNGPCGLVTSMDDMLSWYKHLDNDSKISKSLKNKLDITIKLKDGSAAHSPNGDLTYGQQYEYMGRGIKEIWSYGAMHGYASSVFRFPEFEFTFCVLSNAGLDYNGYIGMQMVTHLLGHKFENQDEEISAPSSFASLTDKIKEKFIGDYVDMESYLQRQILLRDDTLRYYRPNYNDERPLLPMKDGGLYLVSPYGYNALYIESNKDGSKRLDFKAGTHTYPYEKYVKKEYSKGDLESYEGVYYNENLMAMIEIKATENGISASNFKVGNVPLSIYKQDQFIGSELFFKHVKFIRNESKKVNGFYLSQEEFKNIPFTKVEPLDEIN